MFARSPLFKLTPLVLIVMSFSILFYMNYTLLVFGQNMSLRLCSANLITCIAVFQQELLSRLLQLDNLSAYLEWLDHQRHLQFSL